MRIELTPGMTNVVRFPIERRAKPSMDLVRDIAPDSREVSLVIELFGFDDDIDGLRDARRPGNGGLHRAQWVSLVELEATGGSRPAAAADSSNARCRCAARRMTRHWRR